MGGKPAGSQMTARDAYILCPMRAEDLDQVMRIENACAPLPWSPRVFLEELSRPQAHIRLVRRASDAEVVAFINFWTVLDELHLLNVATHPNERRRGHARRLMDDMLAYARSAGCRVVMLEVRRSNERAQSLYRAYGFRSVGVRPGYYADGEDALLMNLDLEAPAVP